MSNTLLWFFAIPIAIIILSIIGETILESHLKVAGITFSILLIVTFAIGDETLLIFTILYTILSYLVAWITSQWASSNNNNSQCSERSLEQMIQEANLNTTVNDNNNTQNNCNCGYNNRRRFF